MFPLTHPVVIRLCHHIGDLRPSHAILERHLIGSRTDAGRFHLASAGHIPKHRASGGVLLLAMPTSAPHHQTDQRQHNDDDSRHRRPDRHAQHLAIDLALGTVVVARTGAHLLLTAQSFVCARAATVAERIRTRMTFASGALRLVRPRISQTSRTLASETAPNVRTAGGRMAIVEIG